MEEKREAADPRPGAKEKQRVRKPMFLHSAYPILLLASMDKAFCKVVGKKAALMEAEAGTKATCGHGWLWALSTHSETLLNTTYPHTGKSLAGEYPPTHPCPSLSASYEMAQRSWGHPSWTLAPGDKQDKELYFCLCFPGPAEVPCRGLGTITTPHSTSPARGHPCYEHHPGSGHPEQQPVQHSWCSTLGLVAKLPLKG